MTAAAEAAGGTGEGVGDGTVPEANVVHDSPGRLRLKVPDRRGDLGFFATLGPRIAEAPDVLEVETNARTASVLIKHRSDRTALLDWVREREILAPHQRLFPPRPLRPSREPDWRTVLAGLVALLALVQLMRGQVLAPAITLAFYAAQVAGWGRPVAPGGGETSDAPASDAPASDGGD